MGDPLVTVICTTLFLAISVLAVMTIVETVRSERMFKRHRREREEMAERHRRENEEVARWAAELEAETDLCIAEWKARQDKLGRHIDNMDL